MKDFGSSSVHIPDNLLNRSVGFVSYRRCNRGLFRGFGKLYTFSIVRFLRDRVDLPVEDGRGRVVSVLPSRSAILTGKTKNFVKQKTAN